MIFQILGYLFYVDSIYWNSFYQVKTYGTP